MVSAIFLAQLGKLQLNLEELLASMEFRLFNAVRESVDGRADEKGESIGDHHQAQETDFRSTCRRSR